MVHPECNASSELREERALAHEDGVGGGLVDAVHERGTRGARQQEPANDAQGGPARQPPLGDEVGLEAHEGLVERVRGPDDTMLTSGETAASMGALESGPSRGAGP